MKPLDLGRLVAGARRWALWFAFVRWLGPVVLALAAGLLVLVLLDAAAALTPALRRGVWLAAAVAAVWFLKTRAARENTNAKTVAAALGGGTKPRDQYLTAWQLAGVGDAFTARLWENLPALDGREARRRVRPAGWGRAAAAGAAGLAAILALCGFALRAPQGPAARVLWPFAAENLDAWLEVTPGDALFARGGDVDIFVRLLTPSEDIPELFVAERGGRWTARPLASGETGRFHGRLSGLTETLRYRLRLGRRRGRAYRLTPFDPPRLRRFSAEVSYPAYAGKSPERAENPFAPDAPLGGRILFEGEWETPVLSADVLDERGGRQSLTADGKRFRWEHRVKGPETLRLWAALAATATVAAELRISARADAPPQAAWLFPDSDLRVAGGEEIPAAVEVDDDHGVAAVFLEVSLNGAPPRRAPWGTAVSQARGAVVLERPWRLGPLNLAAEDTVEAAVVAVDRAGQEGRSETRRLFVASYEAEHKAIALGLELFQSALMERLAEQSALEEEAASAAARPALAEREARLGEKLGRDAQALEGLLRRMAADPGTDEAAMSEFEAIQTDAKELAERGLPEAARGLTNGDTAPMAAATGELERLALAAERAREAQNTRRLLEDQRALTERAAGLEEALAGGLDAADREALAETARRMEEALRRIAERIRDLPQDLSEDFVNQPQVKNLDFNAVAKSLQDLSEAIQRGDGASALAAAQAALAQLQAMEEALGQAGEAAMGAGQGGVSPALAAAVEEARAALEKLAARQEALLTQTRGELESLWRRRLEGQDRALAQLPAQLAEARGLVNALARDLGREGDDDLARQASGVLAMVNALLSDAERAAREGEPALLGARLEESEVLLRGLARLSERARRETAADASSSSVGQSPEELQKKYNRWTDYGGRAAAAADRLGPARRLLGADQAPTLGAADLEQWGRQAGLQAALAADTREFTGKLAGPARETALLGGRLFRRLREAIAAMDRAEQELRPARPAPAAAAQEEALNALRESGESLAQTASALRRRAQSGGRSAAPTLQRARGTGGGSGSATGPVRIPRAGEFRPPAEFREELSRSLKERYPKSHERAVQEYFRHWTK